MSYTFNLDIRRWVMLVLPPVLRKPVLCRFLFAAVAPLRSIYTSFSQRRASNLIYARCDSSYGNIKRTLNTLFPSDDGEISVVPAETTEVEYEKVYVMQSRAEQGAAFVGESYIDRAIPQKLFDVILPPDLYEDEGKKTQIAGIVGRYALPGYGFNITESEEDAEDQLY